MLVPLLEVLQNLVKLSHNFVGASLADNAVVVREHSFYRISGFLRIQLWLLNFELHLTVVHVLLAVAPDHVAKLLASAELILELALCQQLRLLLFA